MPLNISAIRSKAALPLADRAANLVGSVIDSSTSLLAAQTHDIVRFAMGSPADEAVPLAEFRDIAASKMCALPIFRTRRTAFLTSRR